MIPDCSALRAFAPGIITYYYKLIGRKSMIAIISAIEDDDERLTVERWYRRYYGLMFDKAFALSNDENIAHDMINEAFIKIINNYDKVVTLNKFQMATYFVSTINSVTIDYLRKAGREDLVEADDLENFLQKSVIEEKKFYSLEDESIRNYRLSQVIDAIDQLTDREKLLLIDKFYFEKSNREIAKSMDMKETQVHVYVKRVCEKLCNIVEENKKQK